MHIIFLNPWTFVRLRRSTEVCHSQTTPFWLVSYLVEVVFKEKSLTLVAYLMRFLPAKYFCNTWIISCSFSMAFPFIFDLIRRKFCYFGGYPKVREKQNTDFYLCSSRFLLFYSYPSLFLFAVCDIGRLSRVKWYRCTLKHCGDFSASFPE